MTTSSRLFKTEQRAVLSTVREDRVREGQCRHLDRQHTRWTDWLRTTVGIREDIFAGRVLTTRRKIQAMRRRL